MDARDSAKVKIVGLIIGLALVILLVALLTSAPGGGSGPGGFGGMGGSPPGGADSPQSDAVSNNARILDTEISFLANIQNQYPSTFTALCDSLFASIRCADIINPYTGNPIQVVTSPTAGDISWASTGPSNLTVTFYYLDDSGALQSDPHEWGTDFLNDSSVNWQIPVNLSQNEKITYVACGVFLNSFISDYAYDAGWSPGTVPATYSDLLIQYPYLAKVRNDFTGGYAQNVPATSPTAGNLTYATVVQQSIRIYSLSCYGQDGIYIAP
ncbi:MAG: hypothetical protein ACREJQ_02530 [bacterium]